MSFNITRIPLENFSSARPFRLWDYFVSHSHLLIRSAKGPANARNIDLIFNSVYYMEVFDVLHGVSLEEATLEDRAYLEEKWGMRLETQRGKNIYVLVSEGRRNYVIAARLVIEETDSSFEEGLSSARVLGVE